MSTVKIVSDEAEDVPVNHTGYTPLGEDDKKATSEDIAEVLSQTPVIRASIKRFNSRIKALENYGNVSDKTLLDTERFMHIVAGRKVALGIIKKERDYLQARIEKVVSH